MRAVPNQMKVKMIRWLSRTFIFPFLVALSPAVWGAEMGIDELTLEELGQVVYTASRELTSIEAAPSVVSVITARQIERQGLTSLYEVLARMPGFFNATSSYVELVSNRGFVQNINSNYLLLVDGHALNSTATGSFRGLHQMPGLDRVARIEIIRGPGSTLWGSNAGMGIIHIITWNGSELDNGENPFGTLFTSMDYEFDHQRPVLQSNYGKRLDHGGLLLSGNFFNSNAAWTPSYVPGATDSTLQTDRIMNMWDFEDSYDFYGKLNWKGWGLKAGSLRQRAFNPLWTSVDGTNTTWWTTERQWFELGNEWEFAPAWSLQSRLYYDDFTWDRRRERQAHFFSIMRDQLGAQGWGAEAILHYHNDEHHLLFGLSADEKKLSTESKRTVRKNGSERIVIDWPAFTDYNRALFFEETYRGIENWVFTTGLRFDQNKPRDTKTAFLPRLAVAHTITDDWTIKYAYNTGNIRPSAQQARGGITPVPNTVPQSYRKGADKSQKIQSHDLQIFYSRDRTQANITLFYQRFSDLIQWSGFGPVSVDGFDNVTLNETNMGDMVTRGVELEAETLLVDDLRLYGNYAFADAKYQDRFVSFEGQVILDIVNDDAIATEDLTVTGTPRHIWNLGLDWDINDKLRLNLHYRGWTDAWAKQTTAPSFKRFGPEHYVDFNLCYRNFLTRNLTASAYIKNFFNNQHTLPNGIAGGEVVPQNGRQFGLKFSYRF